jgi:hypothetical protein
MPRPRRTTAPAQKAILFAALMSVAVATSGPAWADTTVAPASPDVRSTGAPSPLPEIGRTRSRSLCSTLHDVVAPAILRTKDADTEFASARNAIFDSVAGSISGRAMTNRKIERSLQAMVQDLIALETLLRDRRLAAGTDSAAKGAEKAGQDVVIAMRMLYESQTRQLNLLNAFIETGRRLELSEDDENALLMKSALKGIVPPPQGSTVAGHETYLGGPPRYANQLSEAHDIDRWIGQIVTITDKREDMAGKVISAAAALCR